MGGGGGSMSISAARAAGYTVVSNRTDLLALNTETTTNICGIFGSGAFPYESAWSGNGPHLSDMADVALQMLDNDPDGFFLMIECGLIDTASHGSDIVRANGETLELSATVQDVLTWAAGREDTLIMVAADHETGGLDVLQDNGVGVQPTVLWTSGGNHTASNVLLYATGTNAHLVTGVLDNTDLFRIAADEIPQRADCSSIVVASTSRVDLAWLVAYGETYVIEKSTNLQANDWRPVSVTTSLSAVLSATLTDITNEPSALFYRCMLKN
jgi:alkaline phosphatase